MKRQCPPEIRDSINLRLVERRSVDVYVGRAMFPRRCLLNNLLQQHRLKTQLHYLVRRSHCTGRDTRSSNLMGRHVGPC